MKRFEYRYYKEISHLDSADYQYKVVKAAELCNIQKFALFKGYGYWMRELHDIIRIEFSRSSLMTNEEVKEFKVALDKTFDYGQSTIFFVYEELER